MVKQMTKAKTQTAPDMPVTARNAAKTDAQRAASTIRLLKAQYGSFAAVSRELAKRGHAANRGLLCAVMNGKRPPSKELLIALGLRKPRKVLSEAEKELRREARQTTNALWTLHMAAHAGYTVSIIRADVPGGWWNVEYKHPAYEPISATDASFIDAVQRANDIRFARLTNGNNKTN